jgi:hypothetical protein
MRREQVFFLVLLGILSFNLSYFLTEIFPAPLWWYYPLDQHWEFGITTQPGLRMGWYGKVFLSGLCTATVVTAIGLGLKLSKKTPAQALIQLLVLLNMIMTVFLLYYIARTLMGGP